MLTAAKTRLEASAARLFRTSSGQDLEPVQEHDTVVAGHRVHTLTAGSGDPLVLVHGLLGLAAGWRPLMQVLAQHARVFAPDAIGMGASERVAGCDPSLEAQADRLRQWLDAEGLDRVDLLGTSHGGAVAMTFATLYPERVRSLILHAPANPFCTGSRPQIRFFSSETGRRIARWLPRAPKAIHRFALHRMYGDRTRLRKGSLQEYVSSLRVPGTVEYVLGILGRWTLDMSGLQPLLPRLRKLPVMLLWGEFDRAVTLSSVRTLRQITKAPLEILTGLGHLAFEEHPEQFAAPVLRFLAGKADVLRSA